MERAELKIIGSKIIEGYFDELLEVLNKRPDCLLPKQALYLIVCCCTTCNANINNPDKLNEQKLILAVIGLSKSISKVTIEEYDSYLQSIFFICKLLIKKNYELLLKVEAEILPKFIPKDLTEKQKGVYRSICDLIRNEVLNVTLNNGDIDKKKIILMGNLLSKIIIESLNHSIFLESIFKYGSCLQRMNIDLNVQYHYFLANIKIIINDLSTESILNGILQFVKFGLHLFLSYLKDGMLEKAHHCINDTLNIIPKEGEWEDIKEILNICRYIIDPNLDKTKLAASKDCLIEASKLYRKSENFLITYKLLSQTMVTYSNFCKNYDEKKIFVDSEKNLILYEILTVMAEISLLPYDSCKKGCSCLSRNNFESSDAALCILMLCSSMLSSDKAIDCTSEVKNHLQKYFELLVLRRQYKCKMYSKCWSDVAPYLYNVGVLLLRKERFEEALSFGNMTLKYHCGFGEDVESVVLPSTFNLINSIYCKQKKYKEALIWSAIEIINTSKNCRNKIFYKWIKIKADCRDKNELQELNILSIINLVPTEFSRYIHKAKSLEDKIDLLVAELENYYVKWKSKVPMMSAFKQLCQIADKPTIMKVFVKVFTDEDVLVHEDIPKLLNDVFEEFENCKENMDNTLKLYLSFFMYFKYKHQTKELISKNLEEMDKVIKPKSSTDIDVMPADAFDRCDTVSVYQNLRVDSEKMDSLVKSVTLLEGIILHDMNESLFADIERNKVYRLSKSIAFEFILQSDGFNTLRSLFVAFRIAQHYKDKDLLLECHGYLLRHLNYSLLETELEKTSYQNLASQDYKYLLQYHMNLSYFYVSLKNIELAYKHYKSTKKHWECLAGTNEKSLWCIEVQIELLLFKLMDIAKSTESDMNLRLSYGPLMKAYNMIVDKYTADSHWTTYSMIILLEVFDTLVKMYSNLKMPREVRYFGKQSLTLAQQHVIPVYSSRMLSYLAYADLWGERWDDCRVKLDGIADILLLNKTEKCSKIPKPKHHLTVPSVNDIMEGIQEIMLDAPFESAYNVKSSPASPVLLAQPYRCPFFINHMVCECSHCTSVDLHQIVLSYFHLEALWYMHKGQITLADSFFKGVFKLHQSLLDRRKDISQVFYKYLSKNSDSYRNLPAKECGINNYNSLNELKIYTSINYIKFLASSGAQDAAKKFCESALKKFKIAKTHYPHLYGELLLQKLGFICKPEGNTDVNDTEIESSDANNDSVKIKTPEARVPKTNIPKINSPRMKKFLPPKVIQFNLTDSSSSLTPSKITNDMSTTAKTPKVRVLPPSLRMINTPKLKTVKKSIFDDDMQISTPLGSRQNITSEHDEKQKLPLSEISDMQTIKSKQSTTDLDEKTKLLTSKLKKRQVSENNSRDKSEVVKEPVRRSRRNRT